MYTLNKINDSGVNIWLNRSGKDFITARLWIFTIFFKNFYPWSRNLFRRNKRNAVKSHIETARCWFAKLFWEGTHESKLTHQCQSYQICKILPEFAYSNIHWTSRFSGRLRLEPPWSNRGSDDLLSFPISLVSTIFWSNSFVATWEETAGKTWYIPRPNITPIMLQNWNNLGLIK